MAQAENECRKELLYSGYLTKREVRRLAAGVRGQTGGVSALPKRLETAMRNQRSALAVLGLAVESDTGNVAYYNPVVAYMFVAYLRWHKDGKKKSTIAGANFIKAVLNDEEWTHRYMHGSRMEELRRYVSNKNGAVLKLVPSELQLVG